MERSQKSELVVFVLVLKNIAIILSGFSLSQAVHSVGESHQLVTSHIMPQNIQAVHSSSGTTTGQIETGC